MPPYQLDLVIRDKDGNNCDVFEIKISAKAKNSRARHLLDEKKIRALPFGEARSRNVIYNGPSTTKENGVNFLNATELLNDLPGFVKRLRGGDRMKNRTAMRP